MEFLGKPIGSTTLPLFVAEISGNHKGEIYNAFSLIRTAKESGADFVKIQCYEPECLTINSSSNNFLIKNGPWKGKNLYNLYKDTCTPFSWIEDLFKWAKEIDIPLFSSVYSFKGLETLEKNKCPAYKIASFENNYLELMKEVSSTKKPVIISTGMCNARDIDNILNNTNPELTILLHCVSAYPTQTKDSNLQNITYLKEYGLPVGLSDHSITSETAKIALALGATIFETHLKLDGIDTADSKFSLTPENYSKYIREIQDTFDMIYPAYAYDYDPERASKQLRRSLYVIKDIKKGEKFTKDNIKAIRSAIPGVSPISIDLMLKEPVREDLKAGTRLAYINTKE